MQELYLIRHGDADYFNDCLIPEGRRRVISLGELLRGLLPEGKSYSLVSSPSRRTRETAELLVPMVRTKAGKWIDIEEDPRLSELRSMGNQQEMERYGEQNLELLEQYDTDIGLFTTHERLIRAMAFATSSRFGITLPDEFYRGRAYKRLMVMQLMREYNCTEEEALAAVQELPDPFIDFPVIRPGNALLLGLESKVAKLLRPDY